MKIGILSDTHGFLHSRVVGFFEGMDEIWHAGDIGGIQIINRLEEIAPVAGVHGNIDDYPTRLSFPEYLHFERVGCQIMMTHIAGASGKYHPPVKEQIRKHKPKVFVCGHSHILKIQFIEQYQHLYINPGAAGMNGFHRYLTAVRMEIIDGKPCKLEVLELARG